MARTGMRMTKGTSKRRGGSELRRTASRAKMAVDGSSTMEASRNLKNAVKEDARRISDKTKEKYYNGKTDAELYVIENPMKAVGIAAGIGALIGLIIGSSMAAKSKNKDEEYRRHWDRDY